MAKFVRSEQRGNVLEVTLDRPPANAITREVSRELHAAFCELRDDAELRVGILTGNGPVFQRRLGSQGGGSAADPGASTTTP